MRVRLVRKLADILDGIDVSAYKRGDIVNLSPRDAELLIAEEWAVLAEYTPRRAPPASTAPDVLLDAEQVERRTVERLRRMHEDMEKRVLGDDHRRRVEDRIREELHDARATTLRAIADRPSAPAEPQTATQSPEPANAEVERDPNRDPRKLT